MKPIIIYGPQSSGKSFLAKTISMGFENPVFINGRKNKLFHDPWLYSEVNERTDLIVFSDTLARNLRGLVYLLEEQKIVVQFPEKPDKIYPLPKVIVEGDLDKLYLLHNFKDRAKLIECWYGNYFSFQVKSNPDV